ncbi:ribosome-binding protein 1-like isoform X2 [Actinia tenebrosa]|nr:ribosome-binding protein 1-like isoform X2 [Actinia tenebrosa]
MSLGLDRQRQFIQQSIESTVSNAYDPFIRPYQQLKADKAENPSTESAPNEKPPSETSPNEEPSSETKPNEKPSSEAKPNEKPSSETKPNEKPSSESTPNEKPSSETTPNEKPNSEGEKNKMGSFKIDDGDVIGGGIYEIKPDGMVAMDIKLKISPGASSPALCPAPPCPSEAPKSKSTKAPINIENPPTTVTPAPIAVTASGKIPEETLYSKPESSSKDEPVSSQVNVEGPNEHNTAKTFEAAKQDVKGEFPKTTSMTIKEQEVSTLPSKESLTPITKDEEKTKASSGGFGESRKALGSSGEGATSLFSDAAQARLKAIKQNLRLGSKNLPELNKLQAALSDAATAWAFNYRNADLGRRSDYMAKPRRIYYTHQNYVPMQ